MNPFARFSYAPPSRRGVPRVDYREQLGMRRVKEEAPSITAPSITAPSVTAPSVTAPFINVPPPLITKRGRESTARHHKILSDIQKNTCALCQRALVTFYSSKDSCNLFDCDHKIPIALGGTSEFENLQLLCLDCHRAKTAYDNSQIRSAKKWKHGYIPFTQSQEFQSYILFMAK